MATIKTLETRARKRIILIILGLIIFSFHFIKNLTSTSGFMQAGGVENYALKDGTIRNLDEARISAGKKIRGVSGYCPKSATEGCELVMDGILTLLGLN